MAVVTAPARMSELMELLADMGFSTLGSGCTLGGVHRLFRVIAPEYYRVGRSLIREQRVAIEFGVRFELCRGSSFVAEDDWPAPRLECVLARCRTFVTKRA
jgi:hypothetical protein